MTDYSTWKVTDLKAELKRRGIPQTGLRIKQQIIDRLLQEDAKAREEAANGASPAAQEETQEESQSAEAEEPAKAANADNERDAQDAAPSAAEPLPEQKAEQETAIESISQASPPKADDSTDRPAQPLPTEDSGKGAQEPQDNVSAAGVDDKKLTAAAVAEPVEQAPGEAANGEPMGVDKEKEFPEAAETDAPSVAQAVEGGTGLSTPLHAEEIIEDRRKRKRRSQSPAPNPDEVARKRAKAVAETTPKLPAEETDTTGTDKSLHHGGPIPSSLDMPQQPAAQETLPAAEDANRPETQSKKDVPAKQDMRFKNLFSSTGREQTRPSSPPRDTEMEDAKVEPATHAATAALYIDGLMRPLQPAALRSHLVSIASRPGASPNADVIVDFYLDTIKTHGFVRFVDVSTASRARASLHGTVWPNEKNRKSLFVDFIPEDKVQEWVQIEEGARGRSGPPPRWEVRYEKTDHGVDAILEEVGHKNASTHIPRGPAPKEFTHPPPRGPRAEMKPNDRRPSTRSEADRGAQSGQGFKPLDELFKSTTTKPKLYYLPVPREVADRRLDRFDDLLRKGSYPRRGGDESRRISFEAEDTFVDLGPEFGGRRRGGRGRGRGRGGGMIDPGRDSRRNRH